MSKVRDFPAKPARITPEQLDAWLDQVGIRQNIDWLDVIPSLAGGDEFYVFDVSTGKTRKVTANTMKSFMGGGGGGSSPVLQVAVTEDLTGGNATGTFSDVVLSTTPATITPLSDTSHLLVEVTFVGQISQASGSNFAGGNYNIFDADNSINVALAAYSLQAQSQNSESILLTAPIIMRAWVPNTVTSLRNFQLVGAVNDLDVAVILVANALLWSITEVAD